MHQADLAGADGQLAVAMRLGAVDEHAAGAVHRLDAVLLLVDHGGVHVVLVVVPVTGGEPQLLVHDLRGGDLDVARLVVDLAPVVEQRVLEDHAVGQEEREARRLVAHHEEVHLATDAAMVALLGLLEHGEMRLELVLGGEGGAVHAGEHLVLGIVLPVGAGDAGELEGLEGLGVGEVRAHAHVDVVALLVEGDAGIVCKVADVLDLVLLAALLHEGDGLLAGQLENLELEVLLNDLLHLGLDGGQIVLGEGLVTEIDVVVETVVGGGAVGEVGLGIQALDGLGHDVGGGVADDVQGLVALDLGYRAVVEQSLHMSTFLIRCIT